MKCPKCQSENPDTQSFCGDCGTDLSPDIEALQFTKTLETSSPQLSKGTTLSGRYEILGELGKGGMGEVYLAEDTNLKRRVAIKVLPRQFALDKERLARFEREARLLASLNHHNIATIHGLERSDNQQFLVMELVEGETLRERLQRGALPIEDALQICKQIAEGLESAHGKGIIHRDLKPANVKITPDGKVKILDFGIAKAFHEMPDGTDPSKSPAITDEMTRPGAILGTASYMSPEQSKGKSVDQKTDIWAFGCILFECLTGRRLFAGETISDTIALILKDNPDWEALPKETPVQIQFLLRRCLQKDAAQRLQHIGDGRIALRETLEDPIDATSLQAQRGKAKPLWKRAFPWAVACLLGIIAFVALWGTLTKDAPKESLPVRFVVIPPKGELLNVHTSGSGIALSPDGRALIYPVGWSLFRRSLDSLESSYLAPGKHPFFSPDGKWIGFVDGVLLKKMSLLGGSPQVICDVEYVSTRGGSWGTDETIVFSDGGRLWRVSVSGGSPEQLIDDLSSDQDAARENHCFPRHLPGGKAVLFTIVRSPEDMSIAILDLETKEHEILIDKGTGATYLKCGYLVYAWGNDLLAVEFDINRSEVVGHSFPVVQDVAQQLWFGQTLYTVSSEGTLAYIPNTAAGSTRIVWVDRSGKVERLPLPPAHYGSPRMAPDGEKILFTRQDEKNKIWIYDLGRGILSRLMDEHGEEWLPAWTPDSQKVAFVSTLSDELNGTMLWKAVDSDAPAEVLVDEGSWPCPHSFSPDGKLLAFRMIGKETLYDIWLLPLDEAREPGPFLQTRAYETWPKFSPDGKWIVYVSEESGVLEVYVRSLQSNEGKSRRVSNSGGEFPVWSPNGAEIIYMTGEKIMSVSFQGEPEIILGKPEVMFEWSNMVGYDFLYGYDISPDGQRFLMLEGGESRTITVVLNWLEEFKQRIQE